MMIHRLQTVGLSHNGVASEETRHAAKDLISLKGGGTGEDTMQEMPNGITAKRADPNQGTFDRKTDCCGRPSGEAAPISPVVFLSTVHSLPSPDRELPRTTVVQHR